jgi:hypothetical protein
VLKWFNADSFYSTTDQVSRYSGFASLSKSFCMNMVFSALQDFFGGGRTYEPTPETTSSNVTVTAFSQPNVLQKRMQEEKMSHGGTVRANLSPVRLAVDHGGVVMYFCPMQKLEILEVISEGDGKTIPDSARVEGLDVPSDFKSGLYELENVELTSNGEIQVKATEETTWKYIERAPAF